MLVEAAERARLPRRRTASTPRTCSATSARSPSEELDEAKARTTTRRVHGASVVGRAGLEKEYDQYLRGAARLQAGRRRLDGPRARRLRRGRRPRRRHPGHLDRRAGAGASSSSSSRRRSRPPGRPSTRSRTRTTSPTPARSVVLDAKNGRVVAMASAPTYDPKVWVGGITSKQLERLYSAKAGNPLLFRATQGQFAPGSTWKPIMTAGALNNGFGPSTRLDCSLGLPGRQPAVQELRVRVLRAASASPRRCRSPATRSSTGSATRFWQKYGSDEADVNAKDPLVKTAKVFGFGKPTGDRPARRGERPDRRPALEAGLLEGQQGLLLQGRQEARQRLPARVRPRVLRRGLRLPRRRRGELRDRPGRHAGHPAAVRPGLRRAGQRRHALRAAGRQGDRRPRRQGDPADQADEGRPRPGRAAQRAEATSTRRCWAPPRPAPWPGSSSASRSTRCTIRSKTGSAEVYGKQSTSWVASYDKNYVVLMMVTQAGTGSGTSGPGGAQDLGGALRRPRAWT